MSALLTGSALLLSNGCGIPPQGAEQSAALNKPSQAVSGVVSVQGVGGNCLDVLAANPNPSPAVTVDNFTCNGTRAQVFQFNDDGTITDFWGNCLDVLGANFMQGTVDFSACNGTPAQQWQAAGSAIVGLGGYCLSVVGDNPSPGTIVDLEPCTAAPGQSWSRVKPLTLPADPADFIWTPGPAAGASWIAVGGATPWVIGTDGQPYQYGGTPRARVWNKVSAPTSSTRLTVSPTGDAWRIDVNGQITSLSGSSWTAFPTPGSPACAREIGVGAQQQLWAIGCDVNSTGGTIYQFQSSQWVSRSARATRISVSPEGTAWIADGSGAISKWNGTGFTQVPGAGTAIAAGPKGNTWIISTPSGASDGFPALWNGSQFAQASNLAASQIAVGADGAPWVVTSTNTIARWGGPWRWLGPSGFPELNGGRWSGDVEDISLADNQTHLAVATAGGGVWMLQLGSGAWTPIADTGFAPGPAPAVASLAFKPGDAGTLVVATGVGSGNDGAAQGGNGLWRGDLKNGIWQWTALACADPSLATVPCPTSFTKIRYSRFDASRIYASSANGFFVSTSGGPFVPTPITAGGQTNFGYGVTDFALDDSDGQHVYAAVPGQGIAVSIDAGAHFASLTSPLAPSLTASVFQSSKIALARSAPHVLYVTINAGYDDFNGVFVSRDIRAAQPSWLETGLQGCEEYDGCVYRGGIDNFMRSQNGHDGAIAVSPIDSNTVIAGGAGDWITTNGGGTPTAANCSVLACPVNGWTRLGAVHEDVHAIVFDSSGANVYMGTDGGFFHSSDGGQTWQFDLNTIPVMNEQGVSVKGDTVLCAAWDVGMHWSLDHGGTWTGNSDNDSVGAFVSSANEWFAHKYEDVDNIYKSTDQGASWPTLVEGAVPFHSPIVELNGSVYTVGNADGQGNGVDGIMYLDDGSGNAGVYGSPFPDPNDVPMAVTAVNHLDFYYVIAGGFYKGGTTRRNLQISRNGGSWSEIGATLPTGTPGAPAILTVKRDAPGVAGGHGPHIYVLTSDGRVFADGMEHLAAGNPQWIELTGNLPRNLSYNDLIADPSLGTVVVATNVGLFKTTNSCLSTVLSNGGSCWPTTWRTWGDGLPLVPTVAAAGAPGAVGTAVNALDAQTRSDGHFYVYAAVWERGIWIRDATADDP
ncbi:MAG TPA: ricin-type beta-trefoil lectin domain protein [Polyangia bacterium]|nr:ricin-type beta-trefoil lectin domain protein [Polyangia bacterium]